MHHSFSVHLDYETSERAGAGGMFQVASMEDSEDEDCTHLVDKGRQYQDLDSLARDVAKTLGVGPEEVTLTEI